jgi:hypothetical protein
LPAGSVAARIAMKGERNEYKELSRMSEKFLTFIEIDCRERYERYCFFLFLLGWKMLVNHCILIVNGDSVKEHRVT